MLPTRLVQASVLAMSVFSLWPRMDRRVLASGLPILIHVVDYPRPVAAAVLQVEKHFGWVVTYEDTSYVHPDDIVDHKAGSSRWRYVETRPGHEGGHHRFHLCATDGHG